MKYAFALLVVVSISFTLHAQDITGIWRGYFYSGYGIYRQQYKYELQIDQLNGKRVPGIAKAIKGVTYSYRQTAFYGKANFVGIYNDQTKSITLKEDTLVEVKMTLESFSCLMTCYLEYRKDGNTEILEGSFSSVVDKKGTDCGSGTVYLERVLESDFHKEDFLMKKKPAEEHLEPAAKTTPPPPTKPATVKKDTAATAKRNNTLPPATASVKKPQKPASTTTAKKPAPANTTTAKQAPPIKPPVASNTDSVVATAPKPVLVLPPIDTVAVTHLQQVPAVIRERSNPLVKTIYTSSQDIKVELYDNGEIDGDTITVYHNNQMVVSKGGLTTKAITINLKASASDPHHELIMVADNLGSIPPNTALMVVTTGGKRYEVFISSDEQRNARVVIEYKAP